MKRLILLALMLVGCYGRSFNPKATMCLDPAFNDEQVQDIIDAGQEWHDKTNGDVDFHFVQGGTCEVELKAVAHLRYDDNEVALGITDEWFQWVKFNVEDSWTSKAGNSYTIKDFPLRENVLHEFGHYLTGGNHSGNRLDVMYAKGPALRQYDWTAKQWVTRDPRHLTESDVSRWNGKDHSYNQGSDPYPAEVIEPE